MRNHVFYVVFTIINNHKQGFIDSNFIYYCSLER